MAGGRPTKYTPELLEKAHQYLVEWPDITFPCKSPIPMIAGLALYLGINKDTIYAWIKEDDKPEFSDICTEVLQQQEVICAAKGIEGEFNATITKLMLSKHGYTDKAEVKQTVEFTFNISPEDLLL